MAEDEKFSSDRFRTKNAVAFESDNSDTEEPVRLDLGIDPSRAYERINEIEGAIAGPSSVEAHRREDNPFSFKHFLRNSTTNYQSQGARPKVYCDGRPISSISDLELNESPGIKQTRIVSEFPSALPDFVQDHLVIEQSLLTKENSENGFNIAGNNLPDFAPHRTKNYAHLNGETTHGNRRNDHDPNLRLPLDLPVRGVAFPLDLPITDNNTSGSRSCPIASEVGTSKSLPDFLNDGAVRSKANDENLAGCSIENELDSLRHSVELYRQQLTEQIHCTEQLRRQLDAARNKEIEYTHNLTKALEQVEENLDRSNQRVTAAEDANTKLKQEIKSLKSKTKLLQQENDMLKREQGASSSASISQLSNVETRRFAQDLRMSATSAEQSLRQLLLGVENLRMMASAIENINRIEEKAETTSDIEDSAGPAL